MAERPTEKVMLGRQDVNYKPTGTYLIAVSFVNRKERILVS